MMYSVVYNNYIVKFSSKTCIKNILIDYIPIQKFYILEESTRELILDNLFRKDYFILRTTNSLREVCKINFSRHFIKYVHLENNKIETNISKFIKRL